MLASDSKLLDFQDTLPVGLTALPSGGGWLVVPARHRRLRLTLDSAGEVELRLHTSGRAVRQNVRLAGSGAAELPVEPGQTVRVAASVRNLPAGVAVTLTTTRERFD